ncbi:MAG: S24 family peptidase [Thermodesulfobacteriota bacterium]|nr:S24 family peptidase [Thermodesulfobacteriota bacterium]
MRNINLILDEIKKIKGFVKDSELANLLKVKPNVISTWKSRNTIPYKNLITFCDSEGYSIKWLLYGEGSMYVTSPENEQKSSKSIFSYPEPKMELMLITDQDRVNKIRDTERREHYEAIPLVNDPIAAGTGREIDDKYIEGYAVFYYRWIRGRNMVAVRIKGSSMEPTLYEDSIVAVDLQDKEYQPEKIFAVRYKGECVVKRLIKDRGFLVLQSDNPDKTEYPNMAINLQEDPEPIIGRIAFAWQKF